MKKVLIISYYWPPLGGSGVQRWLKFSKYLLKLDWKPIIYTPENPYFELKDDTLLKEISSEISIWKTPIWEPYTLKDKIFQKGLNNHSAGVISNKYSLKNRFLNWIRGNLFIPDPKVYWVKPSVKFLKNKIKEEGIENIITTGPPHSMHLIGLRLKKIIPHLKWIADFRDPWSKLDLLDEFHLLELSRNKHKKLEKQVIQNADITLTVSPTWALEFKKLGAKRVEIITNGYDVDDFQLSPKKNQKFVIGHYGVLNHLRNPKNLWKALNTLCIEDSEFNSKLEIRLAGNIDREVIMSIESYPNLKNKIKELGYLSHADVLKQYNEADILLLLLFNSQSGLGNYPGKLFEYFATKKTILAFGPNNSDTEYLIKETKSGIYLSYEDYNVKDQILKIYNSNKECNVKDIAKFSREKLTYELADLLNKL